MMNHTQNGMASPNVNPTIAPPKNVNGTHRGMVSPLTEESFRDDPQSVAEVHAEWAAPDRMKEEREEREEENEGDDREGNLDPTQKPAHGLSPPSVQVSGRMTSG